MHDVATLEMLCRRIRALIIRATSAAGSGHPTSSFSAVELMTALLFGGTFHFFADRPAHPNNDRLIFSKGHAAPLLYALWTVAGAISEEELLTLRAFGSRLEGHPTPRFPFADAAMGSLGQGLSVGVGFALHARFEGLPYRTFVLMGDSEMAEGSVWEAIAYAGHRALGNLVGIIDVNRLGQRGETMLGRDSETLCRRVAAFGWDTVSIDGHDLSAILAVYRRAHEARDRPVMIVGKTIKGKAVSFLEDKEGWHGKVLSDEEATRALGEIGAFEPYRGILAAPEDCVPLSRTRATLREPIHYPKKTPVATRAAYGEALCRIGEAYPDVVVLDAEVGNSTGAERFGGLFPDRFFEMYVAEQNMAGVALGLARRGKVPFASTFAAFLSRAHDQIRMTQYSDAHLVYAGSHAGVSIGADGPSQMGLEDIALFRALQGSTVLYPADAVATERLVEAAYAAKGIVYLRTTRAPTSVLYAPDTAFAIGGSKILRQSDNDCATVIAAGITLHEALAAHDILASEAIAIRVIDCYSVKPIDAATLVRAGRETGCIITVEDHFPQGGIGEAVLEAVAAHRIPVHLCAVRKVPVSGSASELLAYEEIDRHAIVKKVREILSMR